MIIKKQPLLVIDLLVCWSDTVDYTPDALTREFNIPNYMG